MKKMRRRKPQLWNDKGGRLACGNEATMQMK